MIAGEPKVSGTWAQRPARRKYIRVKKTIVGKIPHTAYRLPERERAVITQSL